MPKSINTNKAESLKKQGTLHPQPEVIKDDIFHSHEFFDPRDRVQVKYEMLRAYSGNFDHPFRSTVTTQQPSRSPLGDD